MCWFKPSLTCTCCVSRSIPWDTTANSYMKAWSSQWISLRVCSLNVCKRRTKLWIFNWNVMQILPYNSLKSRCVSHQSSQTGPWNRMVGWIRTSGKQQTRGNSRNLAEMKEMDIHGQDEETQTWHHKKSSAMESTTRTKKKCQPKNMSWRKVKQEMKAAGLMSGSMKTTVISGRPHWWSEPHWWSDVIKA